jgi:hypothetical protein
MELYIPLIIIVLWVLLWINKIFQENRFNNEVINTKQFLKELTDVLDEYGGVNEFIKT